ncbi:50S ribosomal protein L25 [Membranihabitans marinus]|uniref:50S ribosomal protein L25 n=1 Tax=Membranihabitans marinus TaxID=1227546 RepID=UPI001F027347|nr:50S ribosomal protein L25 [Membranihabitans marinus]
MQKVNITGNLRDGLGKKNSKRLRREGQIPCVLYGAEENIHFYTDPKQVKTLVFTPEFKLAELTIDGKKYTSILKDSQFHPVSEKVEHLDFLTLTEGTTVKVNVPLRCVGNAPGVKEGGKLIQKVREILIKTTPENLVDELSVDISDMVLGGTKRVKDITVGENISILNSMNIPVASIEIPRALKSASAKAEKEKA